MAKSGVKIHDDVTEAYNEMKMSKLYSYLILRIEDKTMIKVEAKGPPYPGGKNDIIDPDTCRAHYDELKELVKEREEPAYLLFDARMQGFKEKIVFYLWNPDSGKVKDKMLYSSSKDGLTKKLDGVGVKLQANELSELDFDEMKQRLK